MRTRYSLGYVAARLDLHPAFRSVLRVTGSSLASVSVAAGYEVASFVPFAPGAVELLSIIVPVFNEELYLRQVLDALLAKELPIDKEVIIVESASTDSSREIVRSFERKPGVRVLYQDRARGKGNVVREALEHAVERSSSSRTPTSSTTSKTTTRCWSRSCSGARASCSVPGASASTIGRFGNTRPHR